MTKKNILAGLIILVAGSLLLTACSGGQQPTPAAATVDANVIYTQAAQTVQAGIAKTDVAQPTATYTVTVAPTKTMDANMAAALTQTSQAVVQPGKTTTTPTVGAGGAAAGGKTATPTLKANVLPTATSAVVQQPPKATGDKAELVGQDPADGTSVGKKDVITMTLNIKNTGTTTWSTAYTLTFFAGDRMESFNDFNMPHEVKPGETVQLVFELEAPDSSGKKTCIWVMRNADGVNFYPIYFTANVN